MLILPAIDLKGGKCVRLSQGRMEDETVFSDSPVEIARKWEKLGAKLIHVVDLDGAVSGEPRNSEAIVEISKSVSIPIQVGGGIRSSEIAREYFGNGISRVIFGTAAYDNIGVIEKLAKSYPGRVLIGIDAKNGMVAVRGWVEVTKLKAVDLAVRFNNLEIGGIIYTDISRDGMMMGPNINAIKNFASSIDIPVIASGGVSSLEDIRKIAALACYGVGGIIIGKALYAGAIDLKDALKIAAGD